MSGEENERYETKLGNFVEDPTRPGVFFAEEIDQTVLTVPADVSKSGQDMPMSVSPNTLFITSENGDLLDELDKSPINDSQKVGILNNFSLLSSLVNSAGYPGIIQTSNQDSNATSPVPSNPFLPVYGAFSTSNNGIGAFAINTDQNGGGIINLNKGNASELISSLAEVPNISHLNISQEEIDAFDSFVAGHEIKHLNDDNVDPGVPLTSSQTYSAEIKADHETLTTYFDNDYYQLAMDIRALGSLNQVAEVDDHATHIWSEEFQTGIMPTEEQANKIMAAPDLINSELESRLNSDQDIISSMNNNPAERYIYLATLHAEGAFAEQQSENEYVNEYLDKYIDAAERRYPSEQIDEASQRVLMRQASELVYDAEPDMDLSEGDVADKLRDDPAYYYANMKVLRENGTFDSIPRANEIIDRRLAQIEQENPELIRNIDMNAYRERYENDEAPTPPAAPALPSTGLTPPVAPPVPSP